MTRELRLPEEGARAAGFLDWHTLIHRWLVALFRHLDEVPEEALSEWTFRTIPGKGPAGALGNAGDDLCGLAAHSFETGSTFLTLASGFDAEALGQLLREDLLPERIVGDGPAMEEWESRAPGIFRRASSRRRIAILDLPPGSLREDLIPREDFRPAVERDVPALREYERLFARELGDEDPESDFRSLLEREMVFVLEDRGSPAAMIRSNLSDGRYVHLGGLYVRAESRGRGLGGRIVAGLCRRIHDQGLAALIDTSEGNAPALASCRAAGFRDVGRALELRFPEGAWGGGGG